MGLRGSPLYMAPEIILKQTYDAKEQRWNVHIYCSSRTFMFCINFASQASGKVFSSRRSKFRLNKLLIPLQYIFKLFSPVFSVFVICHCALLVPYRKDPKQKPVKSFCVAHLKQCDLFCGSGSTGTIRSIPIYKISTGVPLLFPFGILTYWPHTVPFSSTPYKLYRN